ncbi:MAG: V-type ATPase subunit [Candidatus Micrarchaeia archaeon]
MDSSYIGKYGQLRVLSTEFISVQYMKNMEQKWDEFMKILSATPYKAEIDKFSTLYKMPDLVDVVLNAHMMRTMSNASFAMPSASRAFISAYLSKWDIENIKLILSSKVLGYSVEQTETFLVVQHDIPVGMFSGMITKEDYKNILAQKDIEGVVNSLVKYGYGTILMKYFDSAKRSNNVSEMLLALDMHYFERLIAAYKLHNSYEGSVGSFIAESIDVKNITNMLKAYEFGYGGAEAYVIKGGNISEKALVEALSKGPKAIAEISPFNISNAIAMFEKDHFISYVEAELKRELYKKYLGIFKRSGFSLAFMLYYILRGELERDELRGIWFSKYYKVSDERYRALQIAPYVLG